MRNSCWPGGLGRVLVFGSALLLANSPGLALNAHKALTQFGRQTWRTENGLPQNTVRAITQTHDGYLWLGTEGGLVRFDGLRFVVYDAQNNLKSNNVRSLLEEHGALWIATADGLTRLKNSQFTTFTARDGLPSSDILSLYVDSAGALCAVTAEGAGCFRSGHFQKTAGSKNKAEAVTLVDREGSTWMGSDAGLARMADGKLERFPANDPLSGDAVLSIYEDREGNLWVGTESGGVTVLRDQKFTTYAIKEGSSDDVVRCVFEDRNGVVWIGTDGNGLSRFQNGRFSNLTTSDGLSSNVVMALGEDEDGKLLAGTPDGLNVIRNGRISILTSADGLADDFVRSIFRDPDGSLWIGTRRGLSHLRQGRFTTYTEADGIGSDVVGALLKDRHDDLWIGTLHGLTRLHNGKSTNYTMKDGLSSDVITALHEDEQGDLWIGTQDGGLNRLRDGKFFRFPTKLGLPQTIYGIVEDGRQNFWMPSRAGIFRVDRKELNKFAEGRLSSITVISYGTSDGLRISECSGGGHPAAWKASDGALWFSTLKGVAVVRPEDAGRNRVPPPVAIESVSIDDEFFDAAQPQDVAPGRSRFAFEYAGLSFVAPQKMHFKYQLEGFDRGWIDAGTRRVAYYTNIPPGAYRFRVLARNNDGLWSENAASFRFRVEPRFYQTYWFDAGMLALLGLLGYSAYRWRVSEVEGRFNAVLQERNRIAREIHDTLAQGFAGVSVQLEVVARLLNSSADAAKEHLDQARVLVRNSLAEARRSIWELRSQSVENEDFAARLSKMANEVTAAGPVKVRFQVHGTYRPLRPQVEEQLLMIGQEAVRNAVRHAGAENIHIDLAFEAKKLRMAVADDGCGFAVPFEGGGPDGHFGLKGMRERAEQIQAGLTIDSAAGQGTKISVETTVS